MPSKNISTSANVDMTEAEMLHETEAAEIAQRQERKAAKNIERERDMKETLIRNAAPSEGIKQIILPTGMTDSQAIRTIYLHKKERESTVSVCENIEAYPLDGAVQFFKVLKEIYGWPRLVPTPGFFGPEPPQMYGVKVDAKGTTVQVPWGRIELPGIDGFLNTGLSFLDDRMIFSINGQVKRKHEDAVSNIAAEVRRKVLEESIYRGKAIRIDFRDRDGYVKDFSPADCPRFIDLPNQLIEQVVYSQAVGEIVETTLFTPVRYSNACRAADVPLKRGALLAGEYGTGKTLTAYSLAQLCEENKWTFLYIGDCRDLDAAIKFASYYEPAVIFAEDVDQVARFSGDRTDEMNRVLNTLDGVDSKDHEIMVVLTTNFLEDIDPAFIRPGRIDSVVTITPPDAAAVCRLVRRYAVSKTGVNLLSPSVTDSMIEEALAPLIENKANAAFIRETVERAKLAAIPKLAGNMSKKSGKTPVLQLDAHDLKLAAITEIEHLMLHKKQMAKNPDDEMSVRDSLLGVTDIRKIKTAMKEAIDEQ